MGERQAHVPSYLFPPNVEHVIHVRHCNRVFWL